MKYGPIICDPNSEEARKLIGKVVCVSDSFNELSMNMGGEIGLLFKIDDDPISTTPFVIDMNGSNLFKNHESFTFIREVIEEPPKYRRYKDTNEMVSDYCERFGVAKTDFAMPIIWVMPKHSTRKILIAVYYDEYVTLEWVADRAMNELLEGYTYLDGSPVGKEVKE